MKKRIFARLAGLAVTVLAIGALAVSSRAASQTYCPQIVAPVICDNGKVYINSCYAAKAHAKNCVPYDFGI